MAAVPPKEDVEEFIENVDEISLLIEGLKAGTISPEYVDRKLEDKKPKPREEPKKPAAKQPTQQKEDKVKADAAEEDEEAAKEKEEERKEELMKKVRELQASRLRKLQARQKYEEYVQVGAAACTCAACSTRARLQSRRQQTPQQHPALTGSLRPKCQGGRGAA